MNLQHFDLSPLPALYQGLMNAWRAFSFSREMVTYSMEMFLDEPLFYNPFLKNSFNERVLIQRFTDADLF